MSPSAFACLNRPALAPVELQAVGEDNAATRMELVFSVFDGLVKQGGGSHLQGFRQMRHSAPAET